MFLFTSNKELAELRAEVAHLKWEIKILHQLIAVKEAGADKNLRFLGGLLEMLRQRIEHLEERVPADG